MPPAPQSNIASDSQDAPIGNVTTRDHQASPASNGRGKASLLTPALRPNLSRHYTSLQEHADHVNKTPEASEEATSKMRQGSRRDGFTWGKRSAYEAGDEQRRQSRNPLPPEKHNQGTPPPLEELLRQPANDDADTAHNARVADRNRANSERSNPHHDTPLPTPEIPTRRGTRKSSIVDFAKGLVRHVSDLTMASVPDVAIEPESPREERSLGSVASANSSKDGKEARNPSFVSQATMEDCGAFGTKLRATSSAGNSSRASVTRPVHRPSIARASLKDRREVGFDLSLPLPKPRLPTQDFQHGVTFSSVVPARPRSPRTPWTRDTHEMRATSSNRGVHDPSTAMLPDRYPTEPSSLARLERSLTKVRDRYHMSRPKVKGNRSNVSSGAIEDALVQTPDRKWAPHGTKTPQEPPMRPDAELRELCQTSRAGRAGRWRWPRSTTRSSEGTPQTPAEPSSGRKFSLNPFKRSARILEHDSQDQSVSQLPTSGHFWWIGRQPGSTPTQAKPAVPKLDADPFAAPDLALTGSHRVRTASTVDSEVKVGRQLAGFAFDDDVGSRGIKSKQGPEGHWDSDTLLMSYTSPDQDLGNGTDEEGPEGPPVMEYVPRSSTVDCNPGFEMPGIVTPPAPSDYMDAKRISRPQSTPRSLSPDIWFRVEQRVTPGTPLTPEALLEAEERRKFEWIIPEHLPDSPLCPLHPKYTGYSVGKCFWHAPKSKIIKVEKSKVDGSGQPIGTRTIRQGMRGWEVGAYDSFPQDNKPVRKPRLASLSSP